jgi:ParB family chromosome partitioning protein
MPRRTGLGRGLDALIPGGDEWSPSEGVMSIPVDLIEPNPRQPRSRFGEQELAELASSIREHGVLQPLIVTRDVQHPDRYLLIAGQRRWLAAQQAGLKAVPALVREASEEQRLELALIENVQREDLSPLEMAEAFRQLAEDFHLSHEKIAEQVAKSRTAVTNTLRLLRLPADVQQALADGRISEGHARALLALATPQAQSAALKTVLDHDLNVRQTEELVRRLSGEKTPVTPRPAPPPEIVALEERLRHGLGTKVSLTHGQKGGTITIYYYSDEELDALIGQIVGERDE